MIQEMAEKESERFNVFIVHKSEDQDTAELINKGLREKGLRTCAHYEDFKFGKSVFDNILGAISHSDTVLILLTKNALKSSWVSFEVLMSLEKSQREGHMCLRILFVDVTEAEKKTFMRGTLELIPEITVDFNKEKWQDNLVEKINEKFEMRNLLPAGNVAHGLVFNYYIGYLAYVLPETAKTVEGCEYFKDNEDRFSNKFFVMIPDSCKVKPPEVGQHGNYTIEKMPKALEIAVEHGGKKRTYNPAVYKITRKATSEWYYFTGDSPFILNTMSKMKEMGFADIDLDLQVNRFRLTLMELVQHRNNIQCNETASFVRYNDDEGSLAEGLWNALDEAASSVDQGSANITRKEGKINTSQTATITYAQDTDQDRRLAAELEECLQKHNVTFTNGGNKMHFEVLRKARWNIFVLSEKSVEDPFMYMQYDAAMTASITADQIQVIPILASGSNIKNIPSKYTWATLLKQDEPNYLDKLWKTMQDDGMKMSEKLSAGDVYEGLAYSYLINYIPFNLTMKTKTGRDFMQRFTDARDKFSAGCVVVPKVFVIVSKSCSFPPPGYKFEREELLGEMEPVEQGFRKYGLQFYRMTMKDGKQVCYSREYATPAVALHDMANLPFAGITSEQKTEQVQKFASLCRQIMDHKTFNEQIGDVKDKCEVVYFDDEVQGSKGLDGMITKLEECLVESIRQGHFA